MTDGVNTGLKVTIEFLKSGDMRFFHVTAWHEEEETDVDLLYDRDHGSLELDQQPGLRSSESYRRYRELTYGEFVYFGILHDRLPVAVKSHQAKNYTGNQALPIEKMKLSYRSLCVMKRAGMVYAGDIQKISPEKWWRIRNLGKQSMAEIIHAMQELGLEVQMPAARTEQTSDVT